MCLSQLRWTKWVVFSCGHSTCHACFKQIVSRQKLHAACPLCRSLLAEGDGNRGLPKQNQATGPTATPPTSQNPIPGV